MNGAHRPEEFDVLRRPETVSVVDFIDHALKFRRVLNACPLARRLPGRTSLIHILAAKACGFRRWMAVFCGCCVSYLMGYEALGLGDTELLQSSLRAPDRDPLATRARPDRRWMSVSDCVYPSDCGQSRN